MANHIHCKDLQKQFPFFSHQNKELIYLDNAATTQKHYSVLETITRLYSDGLANVHRSSHYLANQLTEEFERVRIYCVNYINAKSPEEIIFTSGTTEAINLVAMTWGEKHLKEGDEIIVTEMEHHANLIPWQQLSKRTGAILKCIPVKVTGELDLSELDKHLSNKSKLMAVTHVSNVIGTINPIKDIVSKCHQFDCRVLVDGAQAAAHLNIDMQDLGCDFYAFSGHKCYGPEGTGVLYAKSSLLDDCPPWKTGGEMVRQVGMNTATFQGLPLRYEAGTPNITGIIALGSALNFLDTLDKEKVNEELNQLMLKVHDSLKLLEGIKIHSRAKNQSHITAFSIEDCNAMDIAALLNEQGIAVRSGHLCAMPLVNKLNPQGIIRLSLAPYNTMNHIEQFNEGLNQTLELLRT